MVRIWVAWRWRRCCTITRRWTRWRWWRGRTSSGGRRRARLWCWRRGWWRHRRRRRWWSFAERGYRTLWCPKRWCLRRRCRRRRRGRFRSTCWGWTHRLWGPWRLHNQQYLVACRMELLSLCLKKSSIVRFWFGCLNELRWMSQDFDYIYMQVLRNVELICLWIQQIWFCWCTCVCVFNKWISIVMKIMKNKLIVMSICAGTLTEASI